jgi:hypothetical protein
MSGSRRCCLAAIVVLLAACGRAVPPATPTAEEKRLLELLTMDRFIEIVELERDAQGRLVVTTRQGDTRPRYLFAAAPGGPLDIQRLDADPRLTVSDDGTKGTGPEPRGLR